MRTAAVVLLALLAPCAAQDADLVLDSPTFTFFSLGDWGAARDRDDDTARQEAVADQMKLRSATNPPDLVLALGDNFYQDGVTSTGDAAWNDAWRNVYFDNAQDGTPSQLSGIPWLAMLGNHDYHQGDAAAGSQVTRTTSTTDDEWYMTDRFYNYVVQLSDGTRVTFVVIDTPGIAIHETDETEEIYDQADVEANIARVEQALQTASANTDFLFVLGHYPIQSVAEHGNIQQLQEAIRPLLLRYGVDAYMNGHDHSLQHIVKDGVHYLTSGAGCKVGYIQETFLIKRSSDSDPPVESVAGDVYYASVDSGFGYHVITGRTMENWFVDSNGDTVHSFDISAGRKCPDGDAEVCSSSGGGGGSDDGTDAGVIAGAVIGVIVGLALIAAVVMYVTRGSDQGRKQLLEEEKANVDEL